MKNIVKPIRKIIAPITNQQARAVSGGLRCIYCRILLDPHTEAKRNSQTIDHIIPQSKGGNNSIYNRVWCCFECNQLKADRELHEFIEQIRFRVVIDVRFKIMLENIKILQLYRRSAKFLMVRRNKK